MFQNKQRLTEETTVELKPTLQAKNDQMSELNQTMSSMLERVESLQNRLLFLLCSFYSGFMLKSCNYRLQFSCAAGIGSLFVLD